MAQSLVGGVVVFLLCVFLFVAGMRMDDSNARTDRSSYPDLMPIRRSVAALQYENAKLKHMVNATEVENRQLRDKLRAAAKSLTASGVPAVIEADLIANKPKGGPPVMAAEPPAGQQQRQSREFTKERAQAIAPKGQIILSFVNRIRLDFATSYVAHLQRLGLTNWLIGATDRPALKALLRSGTPCFDMSTNLPEGEWPWGSPSFKALGPHKIELIYKSISWGLEVLITDIDAFVLREPFAFIQKWPDAGFLTTSDHLGNTTSDDGLETHNGIHTAFNIGYMFFRK